MASDPNIYRITYSDGSVKYGNRKVLGSVAGTARISCYRKPVKIERLILAAASEDVTDEFLLP